LVIQRFINGVKNTAAWKCNPPETATTGSLNSINSYCEKWGDYTIINALL